MAVRDKVDILIDMTNVLVLKNKEFNRRHEVTVKRMLRQVKKYKVTIRKYEAMHAERNKS